jgi:hypothetical protein
MALGDIVLERGTGTVSAIVAGVTGGRFSHALIWVGTGFIEAVPDGVRALSFARVPIVDRDRWLLLRPLQDHFGIGERAAEETSRMVYKGYDAEGALRTVLGSRPAAAPTRLFCSQLVAEAYHRAGLDLLPSKRPEEVTPNMLAQSECLRRVELPLRRSDEVISGPYPLEFLDRSVAFKASPMFREAEVTRELYRSVEARLKAAPLPHGLALPGNLGEVLDILPSLDHLAREEIADVLLTGMEALGYFNFLKPELQETWPQIRNEAAWHALVPGWRKTVDRFRNNAAAVDAIYQVWPHHLWRTLRTMHRHHVYVLEAFIAKASGSDQLGAI